MYNSSNNFQIHLYIYSLCCLLIHLLIFSLLRCHSIRFCITSRPFYNWQPRGMPNMVRYNSSCAVKRWCVHEQHCCSFYLPPECSYRDKQKYSFITISRGCILYRSYNFVQLLDERIIEIWKHWNNKYSELYSLIKSDLLFERKLAPIEVFSCFLFYREKKL